MSLPLRHLLPIVFTAGLLGWAGWLARAEDGEDVRTVAYFAASRQAAEAIPFTLPGGWVGREVPVPTRATDMLRPNVLISRSFQSLGGGDTVSLLLVQTSDVANLLNHYPPDCYPGQGWTIADSSPAGWDVNGLPITGTVYQMIPPGGDADQPVFIYNFMAHADGATSRDMEGLKSFARRGTGRDFGGGQVQVLFFGDMDRAERDALFETVVAACEPTLRAILGDEAG
ncbi:MAG: exosortase-associated EpsI family protein [Planctomycetota bacterium]